MPQRYITIPSPVTLTNPDDPSDTVVVEFAEIVRKLRNHPQWIASTKHMEAAMAIRESWAEGKDSGCMVLAEDDWSLLKEAVENPKEVVVVGGQTVVRSGLGYTPAVTPDLLPLLNAVRKASTTKPIVSGT